MMLFTWLAVRCFCTEKQESYLVWSCVNFQGSAKRSDESVILIESEDSKPVALHVVERTIDLQRIVLKSSDMDTWSKSDEGAGIAKSWNASA